MCDVTEDSSEDFRMPDSTLSIDEATDDFRSSIPVTSSSIFVTSLPMLSTVVTEVAGIRSSISAASSSCSAAAGGGGEGVGGGSDAGGGGGGDGESPGGGGGGEGDDDDDDKAAPELATTVEAEEAMLVFFCWLTMTTEVDEVAVFSDLVMILLDDVFSVVVFSSTLFFCLWWMTCSVRTVPELSPAAASCGWLTAMVTAAVAALATCGLSGEDSVLVTGCFCPRPPGGVVVVVALAVPAAPGNGAVGLPRCGCLLF